ncbi:MAG: SRPBCC domain-containing protein [Verrucomicrobiota bacterium]
MSSSNTFTSSRVLDAPKEAVFKAISDPEIIANWWGPFGFTNNMEEFDFTPGGNWRHDMIGPDGTVYPNHSVFEEISPERIVIRHLATVHEFVLEILIEAVGDGSRITWNQTFMSEEEFKKCEAYVPRCNVEVLDRLELELAALAPGALDLVFRRIIDAPSEKVFQCWTDPEMIVKWFTPPPYKTVSAQLDVRPGGKTFIMMLSPDGTELPHPGVYLEVIPNKRLVITDAYTEAWKPSAKPFTTIDLHFEDLCGKTKYTAIVRHWTIEDMKAHQEMGFHAGWGKATDQLEALIKSQL